MASVFPSFSSLPLPQRCDLNLGEWIDAKYVVVSELGGGAFGKVYKVEDKNHKLWALKILRLWEVDGAPVMTVSGGKWVVVGILSHSDDVDRDIVIPISSIGG